MFRNLSIDSINQCQSCIPEVQSRIKSLQRMDALVELVREDERARVTFSTPA